VKASSSILPRAYDSIIIIGIEKEGLLSGNQKTVTRDLKPENRKQKLVTGNL
jgi:hypothetical protein